MQLCTISYFFIQFFLIELRNISANEAHTQPLAKFSQRNVKHQLRLSNYYLKKKKTLTRIRNTHTQHLSNHKTVKTFKICINLSNVNKQLKEKNVSRKKQTKVLYNYISFYLQYYPQKKKHNINFIMGKFPFRFTVKANEVKIFSFRLF